MAALHLRIIIFYSRVLVGRAATRQGNYYRSINRNSLHYGFDTIDCKGFTDVLAKAVYWDFALDFDFFAYRIIYLGKI